jgi:hypothetical protein
MMRPSLRLLLLPLVNSISSLWWASSANAFQDSSPFFYFSTAEYISLLPPSLPTISTFSRLRNDRGTESLFYSKVICEG